MTINPNSFYNIAYKIINALYSADLPIVFKGMTVTRLILKQNNINTCRETRDIDGDWTGNKLSLLELENIINEALKQLGDVNVKAYRNYNERTSAGFDIYKNNIKISTFDLSIRKNDFSQLYEIDGIKFKGQTLDKIVTDKIVAISTHKIFRRPKDLFDLYYLTQTTTINKDNTYSIIEQSDYQLGQFIELIERKDEVCHAYETMTWIENKPSFQEVYDCCLHIAKLFIG